MKLTGPWILFLALPGVRVEARPGDSPELAPGPATDAKSAAPEQEPAPEQPSAVPDGEPRPEFASRFGREKSALQRKAPSGTQEAIERGLAWLAAHQGEDGGWDNDGFPARCGKKGPCTGQGSPSHDVGATGLALLAFLGDGHTRTQGEHHEHVARALAWLVKQQNGEGLIGKRLSHDFLYDHAIATTALCEGTGLGAESLREPAEAALRFLMLGHNPGGGWRYDVPAVGDNDTSITAWGVHALVAARAAGLSVDDAALEGAFAWVEEVTDPDTGRVGYSGIGQYSSRTPTNESFPREKGEAMTAAGLWIRLHVSQRPSPASILEKHAKLISRLPPVVDELGNDQYYWYYGTYALFQLGGVHWKDWEAKLRLAVLGTQRKRNDGDAGGSWDPDGPWGYSMGRVGATALMTLILECYTRGEGPEPKKR